MHNAVTEFEGPTPQKTSGLPNRIGPAGFESEKLGIVTLVTDVPCEVVRVEDDVHEGEGAIHASTPEHATSTVTSAS